MEAPTKINPVRQEAARIGFSLQRRRHNLERRIAVAKELEGLWGEVVLKLQKSYPTDGYEL